MAPWCQVLEPSSVHNVLALYLWRPNKFIWIWRWDKGHYSDNYKGHHSDNYKGYYSDNYKGHYSDNYKGHYSSGGQ